MLRFWATKNSKTKILCCKKKKNNNNNNNIWNIAVDFIVTTKLVKTKSNSKYFIRYLDKVIRLLVLILPKMSGYVKTFKVKDGDKDENNKLMSFHINDEKLLQK